MFFKPETLFLIIKTNIREFFIERVFLVVIFFSKKPFSQLLDAFSIERISDVVLARNLVSFVQTNIKGFSRESLMLFSQKSCLVYPNKHKTVFYRDFHLVF